MKAWIREQRTNPSQLAKAVGMTRQHLYAILHNGVRPGGELQMKLAHLTGIEPSAWYPANIARGAAHAHHRRPRTAVVGSTTPPRQASAG